MLLGTYTPKLDDKGRVILPAKFRTDLGDGVVVTRGEERCLYVFSTKEFERVYEKIREAPLTNKQSRDFQRMFLSGASDEKPDSQSRTTRPVKGMLTERPLGYAMLKKLKCYAGPSHPHTAQQPKSLDVSKA